MMIVKNQILSLSHGSVVCWHVWERAGHDTRNCFFHLCWDIGSSRESEQCSVLCIAVSLFALRMPGRFCKLSEGALQGIWFSLSQLSEKPGHGGVPAGGQGKRGALLWFALVSEAQWFYQLFMGFTSLSLPLTPREFSCCQTGCWAHVSVSLRGSGCLWILQEGLRRGPLLFSNPYQVLSSEGNVKAEEGGFGRLLRFSERRRERSSPLAGRAAALTRFALSFVWAAASHSGTYVHVQGWLSS